MTLHFRTYRKLLALFVTKYIHYGFLIGVPGELEVLEDVDQRQCLDCVAKHLDQIVGIKIRLAAQISNDGENEHEAYRWV